MWEYYVLLGLLFISLLLGTVWILFPDRTCILNNQEIQSPECLSKETGPLHR